MIKHRYPFFTFPFTTLTRRDTLRTIFLGLGISEPIVENVQRFFGSILLNVNEIGLGNQPHQGFLLLPCSKFQNLC
jgi:hypothetical protein